MKQEPAQRQTIAWFKLAEFVNHGEKERALSIYNLLAHTIQDRAFAKQLEGDLLFCFNPQQALDSYITAATMYLKEQRIAQAIAVYEQLVIQFPTNNALLAHLVELYQHWHHPTRIFLYLERFIPLFVHTHQEYALCMAIQHLADYLAQEDTFLLLHMLTLQTLAHHNTSAHLNSLIQTTLAHATAQQTTHFIQHVRTHDNLNGTLMQTISNALPDITT